VRARNLAFMDATVPFRLADGRYQTVLHFRLDPSAPQDDVASLAQLLRLAPNGTSVRLGAPSAGVRLIEITGADEGDVFTYATRLLDAIRSVGDLVSELSASPARVPRTTTVDAANWAFEPPGEPEGTERPSPAETSKGPALWARAARRMLRGERS
jgi:hypothetical protein